MKYFDIHSHLHDRKLFKELEAEQVLEKMKKEECGTIVIGIDFANSQKAVKFANQHENIWAAIGQHPADNTEEFFDNEKYQELFDENNLTPPRFQMAGKIVAVGECGLDYYWLNQDLKKGKISEEEFQKQKKWQKKLFEVQIDFAIKNDLPLMLHIRSYQNADAHHDAFKILDKKQAELTVQGRTLQSKKIRANFHFFTEGSEIAREVLKRGFTISFPGVITFAKLDKTIQEVPLEKMMAETDSPFAAPIPHRGKINQPTYVQEVIKKIAEIKNISVEECNQQLLKNTKNFFNL